MSHPAFLFTWILGLVTGFCIGWVSRGPTKHKSSKVRSEQSPLTKFLDWLTSSGPKLPPYRAVTKRHRFFDGENIELECGHRITVFHHQRASFPCEECGELEAQQKEKTK